MEIKDSAHLITDSLPGAFVTQYWPGTWTPPKHETMVEELEAYQMATLSEHKPAFFNWLTNEPPCQCICQIKKKKIDLGSLNY